MNNEQVGLRNSHLPTKTMLAAIAAKHGFKASGLLRLRPVDANVATRYSRWVDEGQNAGMAYLANNLDKRLDPRLLMPEATTMMCFAMSYAPDPSKPLSPDGYSISTYALGKDYHDVVKERLRTIAEELGLTTYRVFCDTAPILERYWAEQAGLGWVGKNRQLIIPGAGSMFFLGEIFTDAVADYEDSPMPSRCGECRRCLDACPTKALGETLDARRCLSYYTIEHRGEIPAEVASFISDSIYGCDRCVMACPYNKHVSPTTISEFHPSEDLCQMTRHDWHTLTIEQYRALFKGSAIKRAKYEGLMRNILLMKN